MIKKFFLQLLPLSLLSLLLSCSELVEPLKNLPDGYARVSVFNYSDIPVSVAFDSGEYGDSDVKGAATENDEIVALAGFSSTFFDVKVLGESRKVWLKIPAGTTAKVLTLTPNSTREFTTGLESIYKRRVRLKFYNYNQTAKNIKITPEDGAGVAPSQGKSYLTADSALFTEALKVRLEGTSIPGVPQVTNVDLIVSGSSSTFEFESANGERVDFGNNETNFVIDPGDRSIRKISKTFSVGPDEPKEYVYYSPMNCRFTVGFDNPPNNNRYDLLTYTFKPVGDSEQEPSEGSIKVGLLHPYGRDKSVDTPISYSPTVQFEYDLVITESLNRKNGRISKLSESSIGNFVCTRNTPDPLKVRVNYGEAGFYPHFIVP